MSIVNGNKDKLVVDMTSMNFDEIKQNIIDFMRGKAEFTDYDFQGSALNALTDQMSYDSQWIAVMANFMGNEMFLDSAILRSSVLSHAKPLGYVSRSKTASIAKITISVTDVKNSPSSLLLPAGTVLNGKNENSNYDFVVMGNYNLLPDKNKTTYSASNVIIKQGFYSSWYFDVKDVNSDRYIIQNEDIDTTTLVVKVRQSETSQFSYIYGYSETLLDLNSRSQVYFLKETTDGFYEVYFGDGIIGKKLEVGNFITCEYLETEGADANGCSLFTLNGSIGGYGKENIFVTTEVNSYGGGLKETIEEIKYNAPLYNAAQDRAIVPNDYVVLLKKSFPNITDFNAWGGEENNPPYFGFIMISGVSVDNFGSGRNLTDDEISSIVNSNVFKKNTFVIKPKFVQSDYIYIDNITKVRCNFTNSVLKPSEVQTEVDAYCNLYNKDLNKYNSEFIYSDFVGEIRNIDSCIKSVDASLNLKKYVTIEKTGNLIYFNNAVEAGSIDSDEFKLYEMDSNRELNESIDVYKLYDDRSGNIKLVKINYSTGVTTFLTDIVGSINYSTGNISLNYINSSSNQITIKCKPVEKNIIGSQNKILSFDMSNLSIEIITM